MSPKRVLMIDFNHTPSLSLLSCYFPSTYPFFPYLLFIVHVSIFFFVFTFYFTVLSLLYPFSTSALTSYLLFLPPLLPFLPLLHLKLLSSAVTYFGCRRILDFTS